MIRTTAGTVAEKVAPLYHRYPSQLAPQPAFICLWLDRHAFDPDADEWLLAGEWSADIGNATPFSVVNRYEFRFPVHPAIRGSSLASLLENPEVQELASRIAAGWDDRWDGNNMVGVLTDDALAAEAELTTLISDEEQGLGWDEGALTEVWNVEDWLADWRPIPGMTLDEMVAQEEAIIASDGHVIVEGDLRPVIERKLEGLA